MNLKHIKIFMVSFIFVVCANAHEPSQHKIEKSFTWNLDVWIIASLILTSSLYTMGVIKLWKRVGTGNSIRKWQVVCFAFGIASLVIALLSPIDALSDRLSYIHMIQHMILMTISAPLFALSSPAFATFWVLPLHLRRRFGIIAKKIKPGKSPWYLLWQPLALSGLFAFTLWIWHLPRFYEAALANEYIHYFQHLCFFIFATLFWRVLLDPIRRLRMSPGLGILYLFLTSLHATLLGVFMTLAPSVWYRSYVGRTEEFSLAAIEDQQLAGLIMWMPACMIYVIATIFLFIAWSRNASARGAFE